MKLKPRAHLFLFRNPCIQKGQMCWLSGCVAKRVLTKQVSSHPRGAHPMKYELFARYNCRHLTGVGECESDIGKQFFLPRRILSNAPVCMHSCDITLTSSALHSQKYPQSLTAFHNDITIMKTWKWNNSHFEKHRLLSFRKLNSN